MSIKVSKNTPIFIYNTIVALDATNPGITRNKKTMALSYHFIWEHVSNNIVQARKIQTRNNFQNLNLQSHRDGYGTAFEVRHTLICSKGGLIITHHNEVRDEILYLA